MSYFSKRRKKTRFLPDRRGNALQEASNGRNEPAVFVKKIYLTGRQQDSLLFARRGPAGGQTELRLRHGQNSLRFEFVQPRYARETETRYSYILENYDTDWSPFYKRSWV